MENQRTILVTGATGALGSEVLLRLANKYTIICLVRGLNREMAIKRVRAIVGKNQNVKAIRGDITEPHCGISDIDRDQLVGRVDCIFHCAASISFRDKTVTHATNVNGVRHILELADLFDVRNVAHVSTAYVAGDVKYFSENDAPSPIVCRPRNYYEETKQVGEAMIRDWAINRDDCQYTIFRPSILLGRGDGTSPTFDAYYGFFQPIYRVAEAMRQRAREGHDLPPDVFVDTVSDVVEIPLVLQASSTATLNLVPINWVGELLVRLLEAPSKNETYHIVNPAPPLVRSVIYKSLQRLKVQGVQIVETVARKLSAIEAQSQLVRRLQRQVDLTLDQYLPYTNQDISFDMNKVPKMLGAAFRLPRQFDATFASDLLDFAIAKNFGKIQ